MWSPLPPRDSTSTTGESPMSRRASPKGLWKPWTSCTRWTRCPLLTCPSEPVELLRVRRRPLVSSALPCSPSLPSTQHWTPTARTQAPLPHPATQQPPSATCRRTSRATRRPRRTARTRSSTLCPAPDSTRSGSSPWKRNLRPCPTSSAATARLQCPPSTWRRRRGSRQSARGWGTG